MIKFSSKQSKLTNFRDFWRPSAWGTAFVKYRHELSPKYLKNYKERERKRREIDKTFNYYNKKKTNQFEGNISGVNWTIPTKCMANRFRSTTASAFVPLYLNKREEISTKATNRDFPGKIGLQSSQNFENRPISLREMRNNKINRGDLSYKHSESNMIDTRRNNDLDFNIFEVREIFNWNRSQILLKCKSSIL